MKQQLLIKVLLIIVGSALSAYGVDLAIYAGFGSATLAVLWQGLSLQLGITIGQASFLVAVVMIVFCLFYDRKQIYIGTILYQVVYSWCTDWFAPMVRYTEYPVINFAIMLLGILTFATGTALYSYTDWGRGSYEAVTFALVEKRHWQTRSVRIGLDISAVLLGMLLGGTAGLCTICTILLSGYTIQWTQKQLQKRLHMR